VALTRQFCDSWPTALGGHATLRIDAGRVRGLSRQRPLVRRRFGVRATEPAAMARQFALLRGFQRLESRRATLAGMVAVTVVAVIGGTITLARPGWPVTVGALAGSIALFAGIMFGLSALTRPRSVARALEAYRWVARRAWLHWREITGDDVPSTPARARTWLEAHPASGGAADQPRVDLLVWIGEFDAARRVAVGLPAGTPWQRFERELELAFVDFVATADGDLRAIRRALEDLPAAEQRIGRAMLAVEEARQLAAAGRPFLDPLVAARDALGAELNGFLLPDLARWLGGRLLVFACLSTLICFVLAGAIPPR
jgi:hypothetical protein